MSDLSILHFSMARRRRNPIVIFFILITCGYIFAQDKAEFKHIFSLAPADHIILDISVPKGDVTISYSHAGEVSVAASARPIADDDKVPVKFFDSYLTVKREGDHIKIQAAPDALSSDKALKIAYTINVPDWIEVNSTVQNGKQTITGVRGPVKLVTGNGDIKASYITAELDAKTDNGNITVIRVGTAARIETGSGNINVKDVGPGSVAIVKKGIGRIETDGVRGSFGAATDAGEIDVKGGVYGDWNLMSISGNIRIGVAAESKFEIDAATLSGQLSVENDDIETPKSADIRACHQKVNGGGKLVKARSDRGNIVIQ